ncbi:hypothetical protein H9P43_006567 [Blastocladiella emersonii ATCC 22665]|nr:hypothetical protein H9P43_006567 [Blastocladiella emersonii ATCC 22665]
MSDKRPMDPPAYDDGSPASSTTALLPPSSPHSAPPPPWSPSDEARPLLVGPPPVPAAAAAQHHHRYYPPAHDAAPVPPSFVASAVLRLKHAVTRVLVFMGSAIAVCCGIACLTVILALVTAGSMFRGGGSSGWAGDDGDSHHVDGVAWSCAALQPITAFRASWRIDATAAEIDKSDAVVRGFDLQVKGIADGMTRFRGLDLDLPDGAVADIALSVHVSHAALRDLVFVDASALDDGTWKLVAQTPERRDVAGIIRSGPVCVAASLNVTLVPPPSSSRHGAVPAQAAAAPFIHSMVVHTVNGDQVLEPATGRAPRAIGAVGNLTLATTNGAISLAAPHPWTVPGRLDVESTNGKVTVDGPLRVGARAAAQTSNGAVSMTAEPISPGSVLGVATTNGHAHLRIPGARPGTVARASSTNGDAAVTLVPARDLDLIEAKASTTMGSAKVMSAAQGWPRRTTRGSRWIGGTARDNFERRLPSSDGDSAPARITVDTTHGSAIASIADAV